MRMTNSSGTGRASPQLLFFPQTGEADLIDRIEPEVKHLPEEGFLVSRNDN